MAFNSYNCMNSGDKVSLSNCAELGVVTSKAIAHNGKSMGSVCVESKNKLFWIKGTCSKHFLNKNSWIFVEGEIEEFDK
mgnify:FL=1